MQETPFQFLGQEDPLEKGQATHSCILGLPCGSVGKESIHNLGDLGSIPGLGRSPGEGKGYQLQYSGLENSMDCTVHGVSNSWTQLSDLHFTSSIIDYNLSSTTICFLCLFCHIILHVSVNYESRNYVLWKTIFCALFR